MPNKVSVEEFARDMREIENNKILLHHRCHFNSTDERWIFEFVAPVPGSKIWRSWHLVVGGWEVSGKDKKELIEKAIRLTERELVRLQKLQEEVKG